MRWNLYRISIALTIRIEGISIALAIRSLEGISMGFLAIHSLDRFLSLGFLSHSLFILDRLISIASLIPPYQSIALA